MAIPTSITELLFDEFAIFDIPSPTNSTTEILFDEFAVFDIPISSTTELLFDEFTVFDIPTSSTTELLFDEFVEWFPRDWSINRMISRLLLMRIID